MILGTLLILLAVVATVVEFTRASGVPKGLRGAVIGLLDLEVLLGIVTWIVVRKPITFIWHPVFMVIGVLAIHMLTRSSQGKSRRAMGWIVGDVLLILGALLFR